MGPKAAEPKPAAGSSKDRQGVMSWPIRNWSTGEEEQLPDIPEASVNLTKVDEETMSVVAYFSMFVSCEWYEIDGRKLTREDVQGIMQMVFYGPNYLLSKPIYNKLVYPMGDLGILSWQGAHAEFHAAWVPQVDRWYKERIRVDRATAARNEALKGFPGRMPPIKVKHMPKILEPALEGYQVCTHYAILKWGKTRENKDITDLDKREIFGHYYGLKKGLILNRETALSMTLADPNKELTRQTELIVSKYEEFFKRAANKVIEAWEEQVKGKVDAAASQSNPIPVTTANFGAMTIDAPANNPYGLTQHEIEHGMRPINDPSRKGKGKEAVDFDDPSRKGKGKEAIDFDEYLNSDAYADSGPEEAPPAAGGGRGVGQSGRRAKRSQRDSTSGSREEEGGGGSKKGKQAVGKKRREE